MINPSHSTAKFDTKNNYMNKFNDSYNYATANHPIECLCKDFIKTNATFGKQRRVIVFGDLHGDFDALVVCLQHLAKVIEIKIVYTNNKKETHYTWIGQDTCVVILGDMLDRYRPDGTILDENNMTPGETPYEEDNIIDLLNFLNVQAHLVGGMVLKILGNHELMNLRHDFKYASPHAQQARYGTTGMSRKDYFRPGGEGAVKMISCGTVPIAIIGDYIFVHGGVLPGIVRELQQQGLKNIFQECADIMYKAFMGTPLTDAEKKTLNTLESRQYSSKNIDASTSFLWERRLGGHQQMSRKQVCIALRMAFKLLGLSTTRTRIVVGHCPQSERTMSLNTENMSWRFINVESADQHRTVFTNPSALINASTGVPFGINYDCPTSTHAGFGQVWRTDVAMSRAFDFEHDRQALNNSNNSDHLDFLLLNRRPQVLEILWDKHTDEYTEKVIVANKDLPRWWRDGDNIHVRVKY